MPPRIKTEIINQFKKIAGPENLLTRKEAMEDYARDEGPAPAQLPEAVVKVADTQEISALLKLANRKKFPVVARGGGTGVTGGAIPPAGGVVISLERMGEIAEIDEDNLMAVVQPGIILQDFQQAVEERGLFYPPDPNSLDSCTLGGNLAEDAGGPRAVKYGVTRDYITGVEAVLPSGEIIEYGGKLVKNVTGYNLLHLLIGSEGTLGIVTRITLRLLAKPKFRVDLLVPFPSIQAAVECVAEILLRHLTPTVIELMDKKCISISREVLEGAVGDPEAGAHLLIEVDGDDEAEVEKRYQRIGEICLNGGAKDVMVADTVSYQDKIWETRRKMRDSLKAVSPTKSSQDIVVPRMKISPLLAGIDKIAETSGLEIVCYGHAGDGNIHVNFLKRELSDGVWEKALKNATVKVFSLAVKLGGTISGEHGIGLTKRNYLTMALKPAAIEAMRRIKETLDPNAILNPGKIFPPS